MARNAQPSIAHKPKDFCTIEQASYIAQEVLKNAPMLRMWSGQGEITETKTIVAALMLLDVRLAVLEMPWHQRMRCRITRWWRAWRGK